MRKQKFLFYIPFIACLLIFPLASLSFGLNTRQIDDIIEAIYKHCPKCVSVFKNQSAKNRLGKIVRNGAISPSNTNRAAMLLAKYGDDGIRIIEDYGDHAITIFHRYGDEGVQFLNKYGDDYVSLVQKSSGDEINKILNHPDGFILLKENQNLLKYYKKHGPQILDCLSKNPFCIEELKHAKNGSKKTLSSLSDSKVSRKTRPETKKSKPKGIKSKNHKRQPSEELSDNMEKAGNKRPKGKWAAHHIVAYAHPKAIPSRRVFLKYGISFNNWRNGVFLKEKYHRRLHTNRYFDEVNRLIRQARSKDDVYMILHLIRGKLMAESFSS